MTIIELGKGLFRLTAPNGIEYIPTGAWYSEVITKSKNIHKYRAFELVDNS